MDPLTTLAAIQDALKAGLVSELGNVACDLGFPTVLEREHVWIEGSADGDIAYDLSNGAASELVVSVTVDAITTFAGDYEDTRARLATLWDAVSDAVAGLSVTDHVTFGRWTVKEGRSASGERQLGFSRDIEFTSWLG